MIDTAQAYLNEEGVGAAIAKSGIPREELYKMDYAIVEHRRIYQTEIRRMCCRVVKAFCHGAK